MDQSSSSGVADSASYSAEYGPTNTSVTRMGGKRYRHRSSRAGQMMPGRMSSRAGQMMPGRMSSRAGGRRRKMHKTRKAKKTNRRRR